MKSSGFERQAELKENYVTSYLQKGKQLIPYKPNFQLFYPAGAMSSTAADMGHYISMLLCNGKYRGTQILDSTTLVKMHETRFKHYEKAEYGWLLGFTEWDWYGKRLIGHGGHIFGFSSQLSLIPEKNIGLFISTNSSSYSNFRDGNLAHTNALQTPKTQLNPHYVLAFVGARTLLVYCFYFNVISFVFIIGH